MIALLCSVGAGAAPDDSATVREGTSDISDDIAPYSGPIGADSPLHGLKLAMEDLDETFTVNDTQRVEKRLDHAGLRIAEIRRELDHNRTATAERALDLYRQKLILTAGSLTPFGSNATILLRAQEMNTRHQTVLAGLMLLYPDTKGLAQAYNNSLLLEQKFGEKTEMRFARFIEKNNKTVYKAVKLEIKKQERAGNDDTAAGEIVGNGKDKIREKEKDQKDPVNGTIAQQSGNKNNIPSITKNPQEDKGSLRDKEKNGRD